MNTRFAHTTKSLLTGAALLAGSVGLSGCFYICTCFVGEPLDSISQCGSAPTEIALAVPDELIVEVSSDLDGVVLFAAILRAKHMQPPMR